MRSRSLAVGFVSGPKVHFPISLARIISLHKSTTKAVYRLAQKLPFPVAARKESS